MRPSGVSVSFLGSWPCDPWSESSNCERRIQPWPQIWSNEPPAKSLRVVPILGLPAVRAWVGTITGPWAWHRWTMAGIGDEQVGKGNEVSPNSGLWRSCDLFPFPWPGILFLVPKCLSSPHSCLYPSVPFSGCLWWPVQLSHSVMSDSLWLHGLKHPRLPYPSPVPGVYSNSCP